MYAAALFLALVASAQAQLAFDSSTGTYSCPVPEGAYCAGDSLSTNIIIRCTSGTGQPGNCNDNLAGISPIGVKSSAQCYQTSVSAGDAACSFNGLAYPDSGMPYPIAGASNSSAGGAAATSAAPYAAGNGTSGGASPTGAATPAPFEGAGAKVMASGALGAAVMVAGLMM
ncbi:hypothetical protein LTS18_006672 [Coniosporium uncinatum]|uniref:Uncharacterized protein n=1 Tax=Coniosporium uncinatum TaxID=93489 RepID=A0ACC3DX81_9PEZI|nr:hypothetical protein LTS18_006672 [Coniosporium uncinatum]